MENGKKRNAANGNEAKPARRATFLRKISSAEKKITTSPPSDVLAFDKWATFLLARARRRASGDWRKIAPKPAQRDVHALKRDLYRYLQQLQRKRGIAKLKRFIQSRDGTRWSGHAESDAAWVIRLVEAEPDNPLLDKSQRHRMRLEMDLAKRHGVKHQLLAAFLREVGDAAAIKRALDDDAPLKWARKYSDAGSSADNAAF